MKRFFVCILCVLILLSVPFSANAEGAGDFKDAGALYEYWTRKDCVPDYITGIWSTDGGYTNLTFGVTNDEAGREGAKQVLALVVNDDTVTIAYQTYALHYLHDVQAELERYLDNHIGFKAVGVYFATNRVEVQVDQEKMDDPNTTAVINALTEKYGNAVFFEFTNAEYIFTIGTVNDAARNANNGFFGKIPNQPASLMTWMYAMFAVCFFCLVALFVSEYKRRKLLIMLANTGMTTAQRPSVSYREIKEAVKNASVDPSEKTDVAVMKRCMDRRKNEG